ncbi:MAG: N-carbamoyl-D-amino acid hydrolase [Planctomycetes bacterium ADurb.Bin126]|nr:MAG: N-carbamoyl-D-amino acid hydrolase [Planctomycetes bacterium ADurb.Bin126]HQL75300.1 carbon-nitrogen hydrolase family protein [Phycisphaerae bacterium]
MRTRLAVLALVLAADSLQAAATSQPASAPIAPVPAPTKFVRIVPISLVWDQGYRTLAHVEAALDEAGAAGADLAVLPEACVDQPAEPIPGPAADAIARKAARHRMNVIGCLREKEGDKTYVTAFLCDRSGKIAGKYRKTHRLPREKDFELGDRLVVLDTDVGAVGLKIGTDQYFPEIDMVYKRRGANLVAWCTSPWPVRDEHTTALSIQGRAADYRLHYAVARYAGRRDYGGYRDAFSWTASWPIGRAQVFDSDGHTLADSGHAGGIAVATVPAGRLASKARAGGLDTKGVYADLTADKDKLPAPFARKADTKRVIRTATIECEGNIDKLLAKLDACGRAGCDVACLWEYVWYHNDDEAVKFRQRNSTWLARIAELAGRHKMYVVIAGELERGFNEAILYGRDGKEIARYTKIIQTTPKESKFYQAGQRVGIFDLDFGRVCLKICADVYAPQIDRVAALHQADLMLFSTQDAGPFTDHTRLRDYGRCLDNGYFLLRAACQTAQTDHRTYVMDPWGMMLAGSQYHCDNEPLIVTLRLDNRPQYHEWPEEMLKAGTYPDPYQRVDEKAKANMYSARPQPVAKGELRAVLLGQRRPELYR